MWDQNAGRRVYREFSAASAIKTDASQSHDPQQGARLVRAFLGISDPRIRVAIVQMVERLGSSPQGLVERAM
jgi:hypothetical protein